MKILARSFYERDTTLVARELIGKILIREYEGCILSGKIVETESYRCDDPACHAYRGKTERTQALFGPPGHAYVYFTYGNHWCLNVVAHDEHHAGGVLIRALEPLKGIEIMQKNRGIQILKRLTSGPGNVAKALAINKAHYGINMTKKGQLYVIDTTINSNDVVAVPRIGISQSKELLLRFCLKSSAYLSVKIAS